MMTHTRNRTRFAAALLLTAAALPFTPSLAQDTQTTVPDPVAATPPPLPTETPPPVETPAPAAAAPAPAVTTAPAEAAAPRATTRRAQATRTVAPRTPARAAPASAPAASAAPAPEAAAPAPAAEAAAPAAEAAPPPPVALPTAPAAAPPAAPADQGSRSILPWAIGGLLVLGLLAFFLLRRRRARTYDEPVYESDRDEIYDAPAPAAVAPVAAAPVAAAVEEGRPEIDLDLRPRRAGVTGDEAVVEFELALDNHGSAVARDVRVSAWMIAAGQGSEMEGALIERPDEASLPPIEAGGAERMAGAVTLPTRGLAGDAVLPVVVAEARYTLPDGSEGRTQATYAVGVPDGEELAHFAIDNPSGLHDDVVARELGEAETA
jgi:hypothetical protein